MVTDLLADRGHAGGFRDKFKGEYARVRIGGEEAHLLKPLTYMNVSGESVQKALQFFKVPLPQVIVVHDELDLPFGVVRVKVGGGLAGHNGLRSIAQHCGGPGFVRVRFGIGRPRGQPVEAYVLSDFSASERAELPDLLARAADAVEATVSRGARAAMNAFNQAEDKGRGKGARGSGGPAKKPSGSGGSSERADDEGDSR
jgi:PTH1 family peptidyl-tRNA hydrolase